MSTQTLPTGDETSPVQDSEYLLRRFPNQPDQFDFASSMPRLNVFLPSRRDATGLSVNRELFMTAEEVKAAASSPALRENGGVAAIKASDIWEIGLSVIPDVSAASRGHALVPEMNRVEYDRVEKDGSRQGKTRIKDLADKLVRKSRIRIAPAK